SRLPSRQQGMQRRMSRRPRTGPVSEQEAYPSLLCRVLNRMAAPDARSTGLGSAATDRVSPAPEADRDVERHHDEGHPNHPRVTRCGGHGDRGDPDNYCECLCECILSTLLFRSHRRSPPSRRSSEGMGIVTHRATSVISTVEGPTRSAALRYVS